MKAIRKSDGKEIDVRLYHSNEYVETEADSGSLGVRVYTEEALILEEPLDWQAFRREAAKDILAAIISGDKIHCTLSCEVASEVAIQYADALIEKLKQEPKKGL